MITPDYATNHVDIEGNVANQTVFAGHGIIHGITIWSDVDGGTVQLFDVNGNAIYPAAKTDYAGGFPIREMIYNGCKVTTTGFTGGKLSVFYAK